MTAIETTPEVIHSAWSGPRCRFCGHDLRITMVDLGMSPLCESFLTAEQLNRAESFYPLHVYVCRHCWLAQVEEYVDRETIFATDYRYFSSYSDSWLRHAQTFVGQAVERLHLGTDSLVVELGSNDGYLLQYFTARNIPALGVEPAANIAAVANAKGVRTYPIFFGQATALDLVAQGMRADLIVGNNVLAQVPDLNDFISGIGTLLKPGGTVSIEFPHLMRLVAENQYDTIYHEHFSYFSFLSACRIFAAHGMTVFDVEELPTHGGSLRIWARHRDDDSRPVSKRADHLLGVERAACVDTEGYYSSFGERVQATRRQLLTFLIQAKEEGQTVLGYGAPGKGNTLLNYCGIRNDLLPYTVDRNPLKHGLYCPGTHIPIHAPERILEDKPDYLLILPWNLTAEIVGQMDGIRDWGGKFVIPIPEVKVIP